MIDSLNAEIALGTIANVQEAIQWLGYTYLFGGLFEVLCVYMLIPQYACAKNRSYTACPTMNLGTILSWVTSAMN